MEIRRIDGADLAPALDLVRRTFLAYEAPDYPPEGTATFENFISDPAAMATLEFWGAYEGERLLGVLATREARRHLTLFFVDPAEMGRGVGKTLFRGVLPELPGPELTVNSSPYAVPVYGRLGFFQTGPERQADGIRSVPMVYRWEDRPAEK